MTEAPAFAGVLLQITQAVNIVKSPAHEAHRLFSHWIPSYLYDHRHYPKLWNIIGFVVY